VTTNFFHSSLLLLFLDPGSGMDKIRIRDKHPGSATLPKSRVSNPDHFYTDPDPDPAFHSIADQDPSFHFNADSDPASHQGDADPDLKPC
jgi:hypothetical protein